MGVLWKVLGLLFAIIGVVLPFAPGLLGVSGTGVRLAFLGGALAFIAIGIVFLKTTPPSGILRCPSCGHEAKPGRSFYYCPECGHTLLPDNDELKPSEINCPFCDEPVSKGTGICPRCSKNLPGFGIEVTRKGPCCRWCKTPVLEGQKFCRYCSAPLRGGESDRGAR